MAQHRDSLLDSLSVQRGHFLYESGHHGNLWLDLNPLFLDPARTRAWATALAGMVAGWGVEVVCGPLSGGAFVAQMLALELGAAFVFAERHASPAQGVSYRIPGGLRTWIQGRRTLVVDDAINAGSALRHTLGDLDACGALSVGVAALLTMGPAAETIAGQRGIPIVALATVERDIWPADACPLCAQGMPLDPLP